MEIQKHIPVLLKETIEGLNIKENGIYVDCTMGGAGHSAEILRRLSKNGHLYCFDQDDYAIYRGQARLLEIGPNFTVIPDNFVNLKENLKKIDISQVDGVLYDLGVSSFQFDVGERGFSYNFDSRLDMRMNQKQDLSAFDIVNYYSYDELKKIFYLYGEERFAPGIAKRIVKEREKQPIETTFELVEIVKKSIPAFARRTGGHPAKQVFQALRIAVNDELNVFEKSLSDAISLLKSQGRIAVITFHSLEDRICKNVFKKHVENQFPSKLPLRANEIKPKFRLVNNKVITPTENELQSNHRAHSAKLRILEKL
ncbi:MAG: Ribosomal RNA small subunit methyltransferase H [Tenericutes bacterium ADurb.BinA124]|nr:MAG: Ribosomal RNA small subunit methyltransferase H [Tenericutes bacterium ADurb.BinA124]